MKLRNKIRNFTITVFKVSAWLTALGVAAGFTCDIWDISIPEIAVKTLYTVILMCAISFFALIIFTFD